MRQTRSAWPAVVVATAATIYILAATQRLSPPVVALEIMGDLGLDPGNMSLMFSMTMFAYAFMQPVAGFWADRFGPRRCLLASALVLGLGSLAFSFSGGLALGLVARTMVGLAAGLALIPCLKLAANWFDPKSFRLASSMVIGAAALSNFAVGRPLALASAGFGWRVPFVALGVLGLVLALAVFIIVKDHPPQNEAEESPPAPPRQNFLKSALTIVKTPAFWLLGLLYAMTDMPYGAFIGLWAGPYLIEVHGASEVLVGNMLSVSAVGFLLGPTLLTILANRINSLNYVLLGICLVNIAIVAVPVLAPADISRRSLYLLCLLGPIGGQVAAFYFVMVKDIFPAELSASAMGMINIFPIIGGAIMQKAIGGILAANETALSPAAAYSQAFTPFLICMFIALPLVIWQLIKEKRSRP